MVAWVGIVGALVGAILTGVAYVIGYRDGRRQP
jgi:hypothetical protein